jgi:ribose 5-phosphate isomerase B
VFRVHVVIGSGHVGFPLKQPLIAHLRQSGHHMVDVGSSDPRRVDFSDIAGALTGRILSGEAERGIMVRGTGVGAANKARGVRAAVPHDWYRAQQAGRA